MWIHFVSFKVQANCNLIVVGNVKINNHYFILTQLITIYVYAYVE